MTITQSSLLFPCCAMVGITAVVWAKLFGDRLHEMRSRKISPQAIATSRQSAKVLQKVNASDNFSNLFEVPVLFYVLCALAFSAQLVTPLLLAGAWTFVILRGLQSLIHCTYNEVMHRFPVYLLSTLILFAMWGVFTVSLLSTLK